MNYFRNNKNVLGRFLLTAFMLVFASGLIFILDDSGFASARQTKISKADTVLVATEARPDKKADEEGGSDSRSGKIPIALPDFRSAIDFFLSFFRTFRPSAYNDSPMHAMPVAHKPAQDTVMHV